MIDFSQDRWKRVKDNARKWWAGELDRPLIQFTVLDRETKRPKPAGPSHYFTSFYDRSVPAQKIVDDWEYRLETSRFLGDDFPHINPYFGPGVGAAFMGAELHNNIEVKTTWFHPREILEPAQLKMQHDPSSPWWPRVCELYRAAGERFGGMVQIDMTDLGGNLDLLATFRTSQNLLMDLYDAPDEVKRLTWEAHERWWDYFTRLSSLSGPDNPGYTSWTPIFSEKPSYMLQCDFAFMISPAMFDEFVKPELQATCRRMVNPFFHLDGPGLLQHLDSLLTIPELKGIQWIPGDGAKDITEWPEVYRRIRDAGKLIQMYLFQSKNGWEALDIIADQLGSAKGIVMIGQGDVSKQDEAMKYIEKYGAAQ